jgi:hypothetical protein
MLILRKKWMVRRMKRKNYFFTILLFFLALAGCTVEERPRPPETLVKINCKKIEVEMGTYEWEQQSLFTNKRIVADSGPPSEMVKDLKVKKVKPGSVANIKFSDGSHPNINAYLWEGDKQGEKLQVKEDKIHIPDEPRKYVVEIFATWPKGKGNASYAFVVDVQSSAQKAGTDNAGSKKDKELEVISSSNFSLDPVNLMTYTGSVNPIEIEEVKNGVYVFGIHGATGLQAISIFSKVSKGESQKSEINLDGENLIIKIESHKAKGEETSTPYMLYGFEVQETPLNYIVIRNGKVEKKEKIGYGEE